LEINLNFHFQAKRRGAALYKMHKKAAIFDSSVKYGGCVYRTIDIIYRCGCVMVCLLSSLLYILWVNIASVDGSRVAAAVVLPPSRL
jgi:hypothetical protein